MQQGEWQECQVFDNEDIILEWQTARCSVCKLYLTTPYMYSFKTYKYCPHCGSIMTTEIINNEQEEI